VRVLITLGQWVKESPSAHCPSVRVSQGFITLLITLRHLHLPLAKWAQFTTSNPKFSKCKRNANITPPFYSSWRLGPPSGSFLSHIWTKILCIWIHEVITPLLRVIITLRLVKKKIVFFIITFFFFHVLLVLTILGLLLLLLPFALQFHSKPRRPCLRKTVLFLCGWEIIPLSCLRLQNNTVNMNDNPCTKSGANSLLLCLWNWWQCGPELRGYWIRLTFPLFPQHTNTHT